MPDADPRWRRLAVPAALALGWTAAVLGMFLAAGLTVSGALILAVPGILLIGSMGAPSRTRDALALAAPLAMLLLLASRLTSWWWTGDDPCLLDSVARHGGLAHFWSPEVWRPLSGTLLMPWLLGSLAVDRVLFGLEPGGFYLHQLLAALALLALVYALVRTRLSPFGAGATALLFAASAPLLSVSLQLAARHYVEGTLLVLAAAILFVRSVSSGRMRTAAAGAVCFGLAVAAKEVFVPVVVLLPLLPVGTLRHRLRSAIPFAVVTAAYVPWRAFMLGPDNVLGGYLPTGLELPPGRIGLWLAGAGLTAPWQLGALLALVGVSAVLLVRRSPWPRESALTGLALLGVLAGPLLPIIAQLSDRHLMLPWLVASAVVGLGLEGARRAWPTAGVLATLAVLLFGLLAVSRSAIWREQGRLEAQYRAEGEHVLASVAPGVVVSGVPHSHFLGCLRRLRVGALGRAAGPAFCVDPCACSKLRPGERRLVHASGRLEALESAPAHGCDVERPLNVDMRYDEARGRVAWTLGPHAQEAGQYGFVLVFGEDGSSGPRQPIAAEGEIGMTLHEPLRLVVTYQAREGWQTLSPVLSLAHDSPRLAWRRLSAQER